MRKAVLLLAAAASVWIGYARQGRPPVPQPWGPRANPPLLQIDVVGADPGTRVWIQVFHAGSLDHVSHLEPHEVGTDPWRHGSAEDDFVVDVYVVGYGEPMWGALHDVRPETQPLTVTLKPGRRVRGRLDRPTNAGRDFPEAVLLFAEGFVAWSTLDSVGRFAAVAPTSPVTAVLWSAPPVQIGRWDPGRPVAWGTADERGWIDVTFRDGVLVGIERTSAFPLEGALVTTVARNGTALRDSEDASGTVFNLWPGRWTIESRAYVEGIPSLRGSVTFDVGDGLPSSRPRLHMAPQR